MQFQGMGKPAIGIVFDSDLGNGIDDALALAMLYGLEGKNEARLISMSTTKSCLRAAAFCDALAARLRAIPPGNEHASAFHYLMIGALEFIFFPHLVYPRKEQEIHQGRKRIDIVYTNSARNGFFLSIAQHAPNRIRVHHD